MGDIMDWRMVATRLRRYAFSLAVIGLMGGCLSVTESRYYTLDMRDSDHVETAHQIEVGRFRTSDALSRPEILIQASPTRVEYYAVDQWASDLAEMVQEKLQIELGPAESPDYRIEGDILSFEQVDGESGAEARVKLRVRGYDALDRRSAEPVLRKTYEDIGMAAGSEPEEVVAALSRVLERVAVQIASDLGRL